MIQTISIKDTRNNLADIVSRVEMTGQEVVITKFGKPRARLVPILSIKSRAGTLDEAFGIWKDRKDIKSSAKWVRVLRDKMSQRLR